MAAVPDPESVLGQRGAASVAAPVPVVAPSITVAAEAASVGGCPFAARCAWRQQRCLDEAPTLRTLVDGHLAACHRAEDVITLSSPERN